MCFLKNVNHKNQLPSQTSHSNKLEKPDSFTDFNSESEIYSTIQIPQKKVQKLDSNFFLLNCLNLMNLNSQMLFSMDQKLLKAQELLNQSNDLLEQPNQLEEESNGKRSAPFNRNIPEKDEINLYATSDSLTTKLFGQTHYQYKLVLNQEFSSTLYKERNFACSIKLVDALTGKVKNNGNIINICFGLCDSEGEWIHETKEGQGFVKGKIETELYHGAAEFVKLAPRDVSRCFPGKSVNVVVYPKPSILKYSGESSLEEHIDYSMIEPLIIRDVSIKAKKRE